MSHQALAPIKALAFNIHSTGLIIPSSSPTNPEPVSHPPNHPLPGMCSVKPPHSPIHRAAAPTTAWSQHCEPRLQASQPRKEDSYNSHTELDPCSPVLHLPLLMVWLLTWTSPGSCVAPPQVNSAHQMGSSVCAQVKQQEQQGMATSFLQKLHTGLTQPFSGVKWGGFIPIKAKIRTSLV